MKKFLYIGSMAAIKTVFEHGNVKNDIRHDAVCTWAVSKDEAVGNIYKECHKTWPTSEGWRDHSIWIDKGKESFFRENPDAFGKINLKDSDVCMEITCKCGAEEHFDGEYLHFYQCSKCGRRYEVQATATLTELSYPEDLEKIAKCHCKRRTS